MFPKRRVLSLRFATHSPRAVGPRFGRMDRMGKGPKPAVSLAEGICRFPALKFQPNLSGSDLIFLEMKQTPTLAFESGI